MQVHGEAADPGLPTRRVIKALAVRETGPARPWRKKGYRALLLDRYEAGGRGDWETLPVGEGLSLPGMSSPWSLAGGLLPGISGRPWRRSALPRGCRQRGGKLS